METSYEMFKARRWSVGAVLVVELLEESSERIAFVVECLLEAFGSAVLGPGFP